MLPIVLVLFVATSAFAAPPESVSQAAVQHTSRANDTGVAFSGRQLFQLWDQVNVEDNNIYILTLQNFLQDLANRGDPTSQAIAASQTIAVLGEIIHGVPGESCSAANAINQYVSSGGGQSYLTTLARNIIAIAAVAENPASMRYSSSSTGRCSNPRSYQFEAAWNGILDAASPDNAALMREEYYVAKRMYNAVDIRSNNVAAATTAAALPTVVQAVQRNLVPINNFLRAEANELGLAASSLAALLLL